MYTQYFNPQQHLPPQVVKIGEGTYGEAFKSGQVVLKFVPMQGTNLINGWPQKGAADLLGEAVIALALTDLSREVDESGARHKGCVGVGAVCLCLCWWLEAAYDRG